MGWEWLPVVADNIVLLPYMQQHAGADAWVKALRGAISCAVMSGVTGVSSGASNSAVMAQSSNGGVQAGEAQRALTHCSSV
jgi:hypothetical protein